MMVRPHPLRAEESTVSHAVARSSNSPLRPHASADASRSRVPVKTAKLLMAAGGESQDFPQRLIVADSRYLPHPPGLSIPARKRGRATAADAERTLGTGEPAVLGGGRRYRQRQSRSHDRHRRGRAISPGTIYGPTEWQGHQSKRGGRCGTDFSVPRKWTTSATWMR